MSQTTHHDKRRRVRRAAANGSVSILEVLSSTDIDEVARLAREIWTEHYGPIISALQIEYMLRTFQSPDAIVRHIGEERVQYFLLETRHTSAGYFAFEIADRMLFLSKIYIRKRMRRRGYARAGIEFVRGVAVNSRCQAVQLTVNRHNVAAMCAYERLGFVRRGERVTDIGHGFVMDDYVYELGVC